METIILANKPLVEAILELKWDVPNVNGAPMDQNYDLLQGHLKSVLQEKLPFYLRLPTGIIPGFNVPYQVQHQFRSGQNSWPLVQLGSGIVTINETSGYKPENFIEFCLDVFNKLTLFWQSTNYTPKLLSVSLRYVDADNFDGKFSDFFEKLGVKIVFEKDILNSAHFKTPELPCYLNIKTELETINPNGILALSITNGHKNEKPAVIWDTQIVSNKEQCVAFSTAPEEWLKSAHHVCHELFFKMISGELRDKYK